jgi:hypothetical protein
MRGMLPVFKAHGNAEKCRAEPRTANCQPSLISVQQEGALLAES